MCPLGCLILATVLVNGHADRSDESHDNVLAVEVLPSHGMMHHRHQHASGSGSMKHHSGLHHGQRAKRADGIPKIPKAKLMAMVAAKAVATTVQANSKYHMADPNAVHAHEFGCFECTKLGTILGCIMLTFGFCWMLRGGMFTDDSTKQDEFESFAQRLGTSKDKVWRPGSFLRFEDPLSEYRFAKTRADDLCKKLRVMSVIVVIAAVDGWLVSTEPKEAHEHAAVSHWEDSALNPVIYNWTSPAAVVFNCSYVCVVFLAASMFVLTYRTEFVNATRLEQQSGIWISAVMILCTVFCSRWHVARMFGEDPNLLFYDYGANDMLFLKIAAIMIYVSINTPLRFCWCVPIVSAGPILYATMAMVLGTPTDKGWIIGIKNHSAMEFLGYEAENTVALSALVIMCLSGVHFNERQNRQAFKGLLKSFEMVQELEENAEEKDIDDGTTAMGKARQSLKVAAATVTQMSAMSDLPKGLIAQLAGVKVHLDTAVNSLKNVDKLFEVDADNVLDGMTGDDGSKAIMKEYINANMGGQRETSDFRFAFEEQNLFDEGAETVAPSDFSNPTAGRPEFCELKLAFEMAVGFGRDWTFDALDLGRKTNSTACIFGGESALISTHYNQVMKARRGCVRAWVREIHSRYLPNAYHNEAHACQVAHQSMWFAKQTGWINNANELHMCSLMIASIGHDVGHIGRTNLFCANSWHPFSLIWNDHCVLESMHAATCFSVMKGDSHIMENLATGQKAHVRNYIVRFILATDIKEHHASLVKLKARMEGDTFMERPAGDSKEDWSRYEEDVIVGGETIIKSSDIGQGMMEWSQHKEWSYRVLCEFFEQGDEEKSLGLQVSPLCERKGYNIIGGQGFFIDVLCKSLFVVLVRFAAASEKAGSGSAWEKMRSSNRDKNGKKLLEDCLELGAQNKEKWKEESANFYPETLSMDVILSKCGKPESTTIYPYKFLKDNMCREPRATDGNLADMVRSRHTPSIDEPTMSAVQFQDDEMDRSSTVVLKADDDIDRAASFMVKQADED